MKIIDAKTKEVIDSLNEKRKKIIQKVLGIVNVFEETYNNEEVPIPYIKSEMKRMGIEEDETDNIIEIMNRDCIVLGCSTTLPYKYGKIQVRAIVYMGIEGLKHRKWEAKCEMEKLKKEKRKSEIKSMKEENIRLRTENLELRARKAELDDTKVKRGILH